MKQRLMEWYVEEEVLDCKLHGFAGSSKKAYCAALYLRYAQSLGIYNTLPGADGSMNLAYFE